MKSIEKKSTEQNAGQNRRIITVPRKSKSENAA